jgi:hypothetical protein
MLRLTSKVAEIRALQLNHFDVPVVIGLILYQQRQLNRFALAWFNQNSGWIQQKQWQIPKNKLYYKDQSWPWLISMYFPASTENTHDADLRVEKYLSNL